MRRAEELIRWIVEQSFAKSGNDLLVELAPKLRRLCVDYELGSEYAASRGAEGVMVPNESGATICFASHTPTRSAVLEELAHVSQWRGVPTPDDDIRLVRDRREVEAKQCLVENAGTLRLPESETLETQNQLEQCQQSLARYEGLLR